VVLSQDGNPYPSGDAYNVYVARRAGNGTKSGAIVVINNDDTNTRGLWVDSSPTGWASWTGVTLVNAFNTAETATVYPDGRVYVQAPPRGYAVYVKQSEVVTYTDPGARERTSVGALVQDPTDSEPEISVWSNPVKDKVTVLVSMPRNESVKLEFITEKGQRIHQVTTQANRAVDVDLSAFTSGLYILRTSVGNIIRTQKIIKE
jgi:alpha-amylase